MIFLLYHLFTLFNKHNIPNNFNIQTIVQRTGDQKISKQQDLLSKDPSSEDCIPIYSLDKGLGFIIGF
jgi:hypothetical protein